MFFTLLNFYILLSLSIRFNCSWNFVSLWLWVALDLSFFVFLFMEFCWFVDVLLNREFQLSFWLQECSQNLLLN